MKPLQAVIHLQVSLQLAMVFIYPWFQSSQDSHRSNGHLQHFATEILCKCLQNLQGSLFSLNLGETFV
jgi:hypothetical protein